MLLTSIGAGRLDQPAALSYLRMIRDGLPAGGINSSYRSLGEQIETFERNYQPARIEYLPGKIDRRYWPEHGWYYRKPGRPATAVPGTSVHTLGRALDLSYSQRAWVKAHGSEYGWIWPEWAQQSATFEPWHFEYEEAKDTASQEDDMYDEKAHALVEEIRAAQTTMNARQIIMLKEQRAQAGLDVSDLAEELADAIGPELDALSDELARMQRDGVNLTKESIQATAVRVWGRKENLDERNTTTP